MAVFPTFSGRPLVYYKTSCWPCLRHGCSQARPLTFSTTISLLRALPPNPLCLHAQFYQCLSIYNSTVPHNHCMYFYILLYDLYDIYNSKVYNIYSRSTSLYTTFCVLASLSFSFQITLMFDTEVTLDIA